MVFEKLKSAQAAVVTEQPQRCYEIQRQPCGRKFLDDLILVLLEDRQNQDRADHRQPGNNRENVVCEHVTPLIRVRSPRVSKGYVRQSCPPLRSLPTLKALNEIKRDGYQQSDYHDQCVVRR